MAAAEIQSLFGGKWKLDRSENFNDFLKAMGVNMVARKMAESLKPTQDISVDGDEIEIVLHTGLMDNKARFKLGEEYEMTTQGGHYKCVAKFEDKKLIIDQQPVDPKKTKPQTLTRELDGEELLMVTPLPNITPTMIHEGAQYQLLSFTLPSNKEDLHLLK